MQPSIGRYDSLELPTTTEEPPFQQTDSAIGPRGLLSPNEPSKQERELHELMFSMCSSKRQTFTTSSHTGSQTGHSNRLRIHVHKGQPFQCGYYLHRHRRLYTDGYGSTCTFQNQSTGMD